MSDQARRHSVAVALVAVLFSATAVQAGVWGGVARGFEAFDYQFGGQRNLLGNGWDIQTAAVYSGQQYHFGFADLTLGSAASPTTSTISAGYTLRGIPSAHFSWNTGGKPLEYTFKMNNGIQDFTTVNGSILVDVSTDVNVLGFYDTRVQISNRGTFTSDGYVENKTGTLAYDVGPIDISGNIYLDILAALTQPLFSAAGTDNPFALSSKTAKTAALNKTVDELRARVDAGEVLSDEEMSQLVNSALMSAIISGRDPSTDTVLQDLFPKPPTTSDNTLNPELTVTTPEPGAAMLMLGASLLLVRRRRSA